MSLKPRNLSFLGFTLDLDEGMLSNGGKPVPLPPKALALLLAFTERPGHIFSKEELLERIWPDTFVEEGNLAYTVRLLRKALHDDPESPKCIETLPRRGYRFIANIEHRADGGRLRSISADALADGLLIGREKEVAEINDLLEREGVRLLTLTGPGGTGKTRLAKEIGHRVLDLFPDGVSYVELDAVSDPLIVPTVVTHSLAVKDNSWASPTDALINELRDRTSLLILDNFEQVLGAAPFVARLLSETDNLKILVTSREALRLKAEIEFSVPPLSIPQDAKAESAFALSQYESVKFFIQKARKVRSSFEILEPDVRAVAEICRRLDGLPLALELAAGRAKILSASEILEKLEYGLSLLAAGPDDLPERQRTMRAAIEWSCSLLNDAEMDVFSRLSVFEGGFTFLAIESILSSARETVAGVELLDAVSSLCEKNLITSPSGSGRTRFRMLVVVREFAAERLRARGHSESLSRAHAEYYLQIAEAAEPELKGSNVADW
ncbi:MAG TPA: winged helix-turn-helix domain-containing protein, partial [Pyrinomonadaceae bacterium]|nr:winged helix-turn-helix domain-containing protein [Pyrinomonadaceae bacterium]